MEEAAPSFAANSDILIGLPLSIEISSNNCSAEFWLCFVQVEVTIQGQLY